MNVGSPNSGTANELRRRPLIATRYARGRHCFSTRSAEAFEAQERESGRQVLLWILRFALAGGAGEESYFLQRIKKLSTLSVAMPRVLDYGIDPDGMVFLAMELIPGKPIAEWQGDARTQLERFVGLVGAVAEFHAQGICFGDICADSAILSEERGVLLTGVIGLIESGARKTSVLPSSDTLAFIAPEQRTGESPTACVDVFALGVLGYQLLTGHAIGEGSVAAGHSGSHRTAPAPSSWNPVLPPWIDEVLGIALEPDSRERYADAGQLYQALQSGAEVGRAGGSPPSGEVLRGIWGASLRKRKKQRDAGAKKKEHIANPTVQIPSLLQQAQADSVPKRAMLSVWLVSMILGACFAVLVFCALQYFQSEDSLEPLLAVHLEYAPTEIKELIEKVGLESVPLRERREAIEQIAQSRHPIAFALLVSLVKGGVSIELESDLHRVIVEKLRASGAVQSARVLEAWIKSASEKNDIRNSPALGYFLYASDANQPLRERLNALEKAEKFEPQMCVKIAAAVAIDGAGAPAVELLRRILSKGGQGAEYAQLGLYGMIAAKETLREFLSGDVLASLPTLSELDLRLVLQRLVEDDQALLRKVVETLLAQGAEGTWRGVFLRPLLEDVSAVSRPLRRSLVRAAFGVVDDEDMFRLGRWSGEQAVLVLQGVVATVAESSASLEAFELLASRGELSQPLRALVEWLRREHWASRAQVARALAILANPRFADGQAIDYAFTVLSPLANAGLLKAIVAGGDSALIGHGLAHLGERASDAELLALLAFPDSVVRIGAIRALRGRNELSVLQEIVRAYENESEPQVRAVYQELHWVTRER